MPTTTNFGWTTPADTDLVKDGASAIRTLGSGIDTSLLDLKGGTSGQYLTKNSNTDLDYAWVTLDAGGMTLISTTTINNAEVLLSSIPATYKDLVVVIRDYLPTLDGQVLRLRFNDDSTANRHAQGAITSNLTFNVTFGDVTNNCDATVADGLYTITIPDYANTVTYKYCIASGVGTNTDGTTINSIFQRTAYNQTGAISSLRFLNSTNVPKSGTILLYGVK